MITWLMLMVLMLRPAPNTILVTIDGVRYQDIYADNARQQLPNLYKDFVDQGIAAGKLSPMVASGPNHISLPGYLEITRGHPSIDCQTNECNPKIDRSVFNLFEKPAVFSSWDVIHRTVPPFSKTYADTVTRLDVETMSHVLHYLTSNNPDFLWVSLGDTDEWGHANNYSQYLTALEDADRFIGLLVTIYPNSNIIVTCDHGRNNNFRDHGYGKESERVWLMMRGPTVPHKGLVKTKPLCLSNIYHTIADLQSGNLSSNSILSRIQ